jgi:hypothetical protein
MSFYEMEPVVVFTSGHAVSSQTVTAEELAGRYLMSLRNTIDWVAHPTVVAALDAYYLTWQPHVNGVAVDIENLGTATSASAVHVADADAESTTILSSTAAVAVAANGELTAPLTAP